MAQSQDVVPVQDPLMLVATQSMKFGAVCGAGGFLFGGAAGIVRGAPPLLFASASSLQTFALGTAFSGIRHGVIQAWTTPERPIAARDLTKASAVAGGVSGGVVGLLTRGRSNVIPGMIMFTLFGAAGQHFYNRWTTPEQSEVPKTSFLTRLTQKSWSPVRMMSNDEYADMLREKLLRVEVEISILDDKIAALKDHERQEVLSSAPSDAKKG